MEAWCGYARLNGALTIGPLITILCTTKLDNSAICWQYIKNGQQARVWFIPLPY
jgi:hypothetical protein